MVRNVARFWMHLLSSPIQLRFVIYRLPLAERLIVVYTPSHPTSSLRENQSTVVYRCSPYGLHQIGNTRSYTFLGFRQIGRLCFPSPYEMAGRFNIVHIYISFTQIQFLI